MEKQILIADEGMVLTDGKVYGKRISLGVNRSPKEFYQITESRYAEMMEEDDQISDSEALEIILGGGTT